MRNRQRNPAEVKADIDLIGPKLTELVALLRRAEKTVADSGVSLRESSSRAAATYAHLVEELWEIACILKIANRSIRECATLQPKLNEIQERPGQNNYDKDSPEALIFYDTFELQREVLVLNKAVHEWINHIAVALKADLKSSKMMSPELCRDLSYVVLIRDRLLTHKKDPQKLSSGSTGYENLATARVHRLPLGLPDNVIAEINGIFRGCSGDLPPESRSEVNVYMQFGLLAHFHTCVDTKYRAQIKSLVEKYGANCPSLEELADLAVRLTNEIVVPLAGEVAATPNDS